MTKQNTQIVAAYSSVYQFVYLIFGIVEGMLLIRFLFRLFGANQGAGFVRFVYVFTDFLMAPFAFIFPTVVEEGAVVEGSVLVAMVMYALFAWIIYRLIEIFYTTEYS